MLQLAYGLIFLILILIHLIVTKKPRNFNNVIEIITLYGLVIFVGLTGIFAALVHLVFATQVAQSIGWSPGEGFQSEVAMANLAFGVLGFFCIWFRKYFWLATAIGSAIFLLGAAGVHIYYIISKHDLATNNAGTLLYLGDIVFPILLLILVIIYLKRNSQSVVIQK